MSFSEELKAKIFRATVRSRSEVAQEAFEYVFELDRPISFKAGQYLWVQLLNAAYTDDRGDRRAFSIASTPIDQNRVTILLRRTESAFHRSLHALEIGQEVEILGPFGSSFCLPSSDVQAAHFVAGGVGIAPFLSMLRFAVANGEHLSKVVLHYLNDSEARAAYLSELKELDAQHEWFELRNIVGRTGLSADLKTEGPGAHERWYIAGPAAMVNQAAKILRKADVAETALVFDQYYPGKDTGSDQLATFLRASRAIQIITTFDAWRTNFVRQRLRWIVLLSAFFAFSSSGLFYFSGERYDISTAAGIGTLLLFILMTAFPKWVDFGARAALSLAAALLILALTQDGFSHVVVWMAVFPITAFLFFASRGLYWAIIFCIAVVAVSLLSVGGMLGTSLNEIEFLQVSLSVLFISFLAYSYERIVTMAAKEVDRLRILNSIFRETVDNATTHMVITDTNGVVWFANQAAARITGYSVSEIIGNTPRLWGGLESPEFYNKLWQAKREGRSFAGEIHNHRKNNEVYTALAHISPIRDETGQIIGYLGTEEDITQIRNAEIDSRERAAQVERVNRLMVDRELKMLELKKELQRLRDEKR